MNTISLEGHPAGHLALSHACFPSYLARCVSAVSAVLPLIDLRLTDRLGRNLLHLASMHGLTELVPHLIQLAGDADIEGELPLHYAIDHGHLQIVDLLTAGEFEGVAQRAREAAQWNVVARLVEKGLDIGDP